MSIIKNARNFLNTVKTENRVEIKYPLAKIIPNVPLMARGGTYKNKFPEGIIIHFTGGWQNQRPKDAIYYANSHGHRYFFIAENGDVYQQFDLSGYGPHAGESLCPITKRKTVSQFYVGIEVACGGKLIDSDKDSQIDDTYFKQNIDPSNIRYGAYRGKYQWSEGSYEKFTQDQERELINLCVWLCKNGVNPDLILGHDEVAPKRKNDPGLSLSVKMDEFREKIKSLL